MKTDELLAQKKLIAEFMCEKVQPWNGNKVWRKKFKTYAACEKWIEKNNIEATAMWNWGKVTKDYDTSWDDLMPVVKKVFYSVVNENTKPHTDILEQLQFHLFQFNKILVIDSCCWYIEWYNENKHTP